MGIAQGDEVTPTTPVQVEQAQLDTAPERFPLRSLALIIGCGVALRLLTMWAIWSNGGSPLIGDEGNYVLSALSLADGQGIPDLWLWIRAPGFIFFSAGIFALTDGSLFALNLAQIALSVPIHLLAYHLGALTTEDTGIARRAGLWSAALIAGNPFMVFSDNFFLSEPLYLLWVLLVVFALSKHASLTRSGADQKRAWLWLAAAGIFAGAGMLTRPNLQLYVPLVGMWLLFLHRHTPLPALGRAVLFVALAIGVVLPWSLYNTARHGQFIFVDTVGAYVLFLDNTDLPAAEVGSILSAIPNHGDRQSYAFKQGSEWIMNNKGEFAARTFNRVVTSWSADPFTDLRYPVRDKLPGTAPWLRDLYAWSASAFYLLITALAIGGLLTAPRSDLKLLTLLFLAAYVVFVGLSNNEFRYRLPVIGLVSAFGGYALARGEGFWPVRREGRWRAKSAIALIVGLLFALISMPLILPGLGRSIEARSAELNANVQSDPEARAAQMERVAELDGTFSHPMREAGLSWMAAGRPQEALDAYFEAITREPNDWRARALLSERYRGTGDLNRSKKMANGGDEIFHPIMQRWAWEQSLAPDTKLDVGGIDLGWIKGFHAAEAESGSVTYRWSTEAASLKVGRQANTSRIVVRARALGGPNGEPMPVSWRIAGRDMGVTSMDPQWRDYQFQLPPETPPSDAVVIELSAPARRPALVDRRQIAVAIDEVRAEP